MGSSFGTLFRISTFGESHGAAVGVVIDGCPPRLPLAAAEIQAELDRRRPGQSAITTQRREADVVEILSGVHEGQTLGTPIALVVRNQDQRGGDYDEMKTKFRPSHADYTYQAKYGIRAWPGGGRTSARETVDRAAVEANIIRCPDAGVAERMIALVDGARKAGDSLGGVVEAVARGVPVGWGDPVFDKLDADLAKAMLSLPAAKGFEIGSGFAGTQLSGVQHNDPFYDASGTVRTRTNRSGGVQGGISNGESILLRVAFKPTATILREQETVDIEGHDTTIKARGRHDPCVLPRAVPIVEAMIALVLADHALRHRAQCS